MWARLRRCAITALAAVLAITGMAGIASADKVSPAAPATGVENTSGDARILDYWTPERMRTATAEPLPDAGEQVRPSKKVADVLPGRSATGSLPTRGLAAASGKPGPSAFAGAVADRWNNQGLMPARSIGKVFYVRPDGTNGYCSGSVISASNLNTVWTAGHCIHVGGGGANNYFHDFIFVPDADNGLEPHGRWTWKYANTTVGWQDSRDFNFDLAAIAFFPQRERGDLQPWTGSQGYRFGFGQDFPSIHHFGYPQTGFRRTDFTGNDLWFCLSPTSRDSGDRLRQECDMRHGASGGPWLDDLQVDRGWGYIVGANSHSEIDGNGNPVNYNVWSANHGDGAINVYNDVSVR